MTDKRLYTSRTRLRRLPESHKGNQKLDQNFRREAHFLSVSYFRPMDNGVLLKENIAGVDDLMGK